MHILMVCLGNICRSPIAEGVMHALIIKHRLPWKVDSAGTENYHIGAAPHEYSQKICQKNNIDISFQKARLFEKGDFRKYDKIYAMSADVLENIKKMAGKEFRPQQISLFLDELHPGSGQSVPDPWYGSEEGYTEVFSMIEDTCQAIVERYKI